MAIQFRLVGTHRSVARDLRGKKGPVPKRQSQRSTARLSVPKSSSHTATGPIPVRNSDKYQRILDAAIAVIAEKGFFTARIADIAARADVADGTVYLYFKSKEEILMKAI